jgi:glycoside/pentoside/hexuronide:cation symporter, GPH family
VTAAVAPGPARLACYGALGLPLAFAALPLYVQWPAHAAAHWGLPLAGLGVLLLAVRLADALLDPLFGRWADAAFSRAPRRAWWLAGGASALAVAGVAALFLAPTASAPGLAWAWAALLLALTSWGYSLAVIVHQAWAARLGGGAPEQARWVGAREGLALAGVIAASVLPAWIGWERTVVLLALLALAAWTALGRVHPDPTAPGPGATPGRAATSPWRVPAFRALMGVYALNALANALPETLVLFFVRDVLQADERAAGMLLGLYFVAAALAMPLWVRVVARAGLLPAWGAGMALAVLAFVGAGSLGPGDTLAFALICAGSGLALGADLVVAPTLLAQLHRRHATAADPGLWFGWWALVGKLVLALAAGLALPLLQSLGYRPGGGQAAALLWTYAALPCAIKLTALALLVAYRRLLIEDSDGPGRTSMLGEASP